MTKGHHSLLQIHFNPLTRRHRINLGVGECKTPFVLRSPNFLKRQKVEVRTDEGDRHWTINLTPSRILLLKFSPILDFHLSTKLGFRFLEKFI